MSNAYQSMGGSALALALCVSTACRGEDISYDCENQHLRFNDRTQQQAPTLRPSPPSQGPYPVAIELSGDGLNKLLATVIDQGVPFTGTVPFGVLPQGPADASFAPTSAPTMRLDPVDRCPACVVFHLDFSVNLASPTMPLSSGVGFVDLNVPLRLDHDVEHERTTLVAEYGNATIGAWYLTVFGFDSETHTMLAGALKILMAEQIAANYGDLELLELTPWSLAGDQIDLVAQELHIANAQDKLVVALQTNLPLDAGVGLDLDVPLPAGTTMAVSIDPRLMLPLAQHMMEQGEIPRIYNEDGQPDPQGIYGLTLENIALSPPGIQGFDSLFRVWRFAEGYCGFAEASMPLSLAVDGSNRNVVVTPQEAVLIAGEGSGAAALHERELVEDNQHLIARFRRDLADALASAINYEGLDLEQRTIVFTNQGVDTGPNQLRTYFDFVVLVDE